MTDFSEAPIGVGDLRSRFPLGDDQAFAESGAVAVPMGVASTLRLSDRVRRMVDNAVRAFPVVVLVGPPGTGKGFILTDLVRRVNANPEEFGFAPVHSSPVWPDPLRKTPDESTSLSDLVGSWVPDPATPGSLRWSSGVVLDAITSDRWLILDELNRADLDKILGPLLSWLAGEPVELGTLTSDASSPRLILDWDLTRAESTVHPAEGLSVPDDGTAATITFYGGRDFRVLGTFNPQDAHRVFSLGMALGRRLRTVPIPPIDKEDMGALLEERYPDLAESTRTRVLNMYVAHKSMDRTRVGPALFLEMPRYIVAGLDAEGVSRADSVEPLVTELLQESYVICVGRILRALGPEVRGQLAAVEGMTLALDASAWVWIEEAIADLG